MASVAATSTTHTPGAAYSAEEVAFFAGDQQITIQARAPIPGLSLLDGDIEEISALRQAEVPLWLALFLKRRGKCRIVAPDWLAPEQLEETLAEERRNHERFAPLPYHYLEVAFELLSVAEDDLQEANRIRVALVDIEDTRRAKLARGLKTIDHNTDVITLPDISAMELSRIRGVATGALTRSASSTRARTARPTAAAAPAAEAAAAVMAAVREAAAFQAAMAAAAAATRGCRRRSSDSGEADRREARVGAAGGPQPRARFAALARRRGGIDCFVYTGGGKRLEERLVILLRSSLYVVRVAMGWRVESEEGAVQWFF